MIRHPMIEKYKEIEHKVIMQWRRDREQIPYALLIALIIGLSTYFLFDGIVKTQDARYQGLQSISYVEVQQ